MGLGMDQAAIRKAPNGPANNAKRARNLLTPIKNSGQSAQQDGARPYKTHQSSPERGFFTPGTHKSMAARRRKVELSDAWKDKIRVSMLMNRLVDHMLGKTSMTTTQVRAAEIVLSKLVPSLSSTTTDMRVTNYTEVLARIAAAEQAQVGNAALLRLDSEPAPINASPVTITSH